MKKISVYVLFIVLAFVFSSIASATPTVEIFAWENSLMKNPLNTGIHLNAGDFLSVTVDPSDMWSAGSGPRVSNADGLGNPYGGNYGYYSNGSSSFLYGSLIGKIGSGGYFFVGTSFHNYVPNSGDLILLYWDSNYYDNFGYVTAEIDVNPVPEPSTMALLLLGIISVICFKRKLT